MTTRDKRPARRDRVILYTATPAGVVLLVGTWLGNSLGFTLLPFDQHHILGQLVGFGLIIYGLSHWR